ncbi:glutamate [NMDA] receptor [Sarcoptes scabiei]|nr:glutamate [NMDA] receptor [Sarcoptes scabiei]
MAPKQIIQGPNRFGVRVFAPNSIRILDSIDRFHRSSTLLISIVIICSILGSSLTDPIAQSSSSSLSSGYPSHHHHLLLNSHPSSSHNSLHHSSPLSLSSSSSSSSSRSSFGDYLPSISRSSISQPSNSLFPIHHQSSSSPNHLHHQQSMLMSSSHHQSLASSQGNVFHADDVIMSPPEQADVEDADPDELEDDFDVNDDFSYYDNDQSSSSSSSTITPNANNTSDLDENSHQYFLRIEKPLTNLTKESGDDVRLKCEFSGKPKLKVNWYKNEAPIELETGKISVKSTKIQPDRIRARLIIKRLDTHDTGYYKCEATNGYTTIESTGVLVVKAYDFNQPNMNNPPQFSPPETIMQPSFSMPNIDAKQLLDGPGMCQQYRGSACSQFLQNHSIYVRNEYWQQIMDEKLLAAFTVIVHSPDVSVQCHRYAISSLCFHVFSLCDDTVPHPHPRKVCRDECEMLENNICHMEYTIAKKHPLIGHQDILPDCDDLPPIGSREGQRCVRLGIPNTISVSPDHNCYYDRGQTYRGTDSQTQSGAQCLYWSQQIFLRTSEYPELTGHNYCRNPGGREGQPWCYVHDFRKEFCDIPKCFDQYLWFYIVSPIVCALILFISLVCICCIRRRKIVARRNRALLDDHHKHTILSASNSLNAKLNGFLSNGTGTNAGLLSSFNGQPKSNGITTSLTSNSSCSNGSNNPSNRNRYALEQMGNSVEMNSLLPQNHYNHSQQSHGHHTSDNQHLSSSSSSNGSTSGRAHSGRSPTEYPISNVRFIQELGEGAFGKVYRGELFMSNGGPLVIPIAIKTLKENSSIKTKADFRREADLMAELQHPNIVCLLGVCFTEEPMCMLFEYMRKGDLHEYLVIHGPNPPITSIAVDPSEILEISDCLHIATQIAAGMEYLSSHHYVHRDLAARNCLVGEHLTVKISDFGLSRDIYSSDYYRVQSKSLLPVRWMPAESCLYGRFTTESDVWSFGVLLWEIFSYGQQPYSGYSNTEVIEMVRSRQLLACPVGCPQHIYSMMLECWQETAGQRPAFHDLHSRLRSWEAVHARDARKSSSNESNGVRQASITTASTRLYNSGGAVAYQTTMLTDNTIASPLLSNKNIHQGLPLPPPPPPIPPPSTSATSNSLIANRTNNAVFPGPSIGGGNFTPATVQYSQQGIFLNGDQLHTCQTNNNLNHLHYQFSSANSASSNSIAANNGTNSRPNTPSVTRANKLPTILGHC